MDDYTLWMHALSGSAGIMVGWMIVSWIKARQKLREAEAAVAKAKEAAARMIDTEDGS